MFRVRVRVRVRVSCPDTAAEVTPPPGVLMDPPACSAPRFAGVVKQESHPRSLVALSAAA